MSDEICCFSDVSDGPIIIRALHNVGIELCVREVVGTSERSSNKSSVIESVTHYLFTLYYTAFLFGSIGVHDLQTVLKKAH